MMKKLLPLFLLSLLGYLLFFPETALASARDGLLLWYRSVVPVLFPFMLLCSIMLQTGMISALPSPFLTVFQKIFGCSADGAFAIFTGFLCGFPMGAKVTSDLTGSKRISPEEARFLYGFANNLSPGFLVSYLAAEQMKLPKLRFLFLLNILGAALVYGILTSISFRRKKEKAEVFSAADSTHALHSESSFPVIHASRELFQILDDCIYSSIQNTLRLGGYIVFFSILSGAALEFLSGSSPVLLLFTASIEVTKGISLLADPSLPFSFRFLAIHGLAAFGGFSALAQTAGIARMDRAVLFYYIKSRVMITLLSVSFALITLLFSLFLF